MQLSDNGATVIAQFEGIRLKPYNDTNNFATVGIGHLIRKGPVESTDQPITLQQAYDLFRDDAKIEIAVVNQRLKVPITQNQFDALVSLSYNIGVGNFMKSPIPSLINQGNIAAVPLEFMKHDRDRTGAVIHGLEIRRTKEVELFNTI